jgi:hypothetical protein
VSAAPKRNVLLAIADATGDLYCVTFAENTPEQVAAPRRHAAWWQRWARTAAAREAFRRNHRGGPCFPCRVVVEPYDDGETPAALER